MRFKFPSIFSARCFTFKTISFSHCWRLLSLDMRPTCSAPPSIIHFPLCPGLLAATRSPNVVLLVLLYRTTTSGKFLRLKTRYNGTSRLPRASYCRLWNKSGGPYRSLPKFQTCIVTRDTLWYCLSTDCINFPNCHHFRKLCCATYSGYPCHENYTFMT